MLRQKPTDQEKQWIYGLNPVLEAIRSGRLIETIFIAKQRLPDLQTLVRVAESKGIPVNAAEREFFEERFPKGHQGIAAAVEQKRLLAVEDLLQVPEERREPALFLILDGVEDPRNFGAVLRVADAAGVHGVVFQSRRSAGITPVVSKASAGALEHVPLAEVVNIKHAMRKFSDAGLLLVGAEAETGTTLWDVDLKAPLALVVGSEGQGLRRTVREMCDVLASLPMKGMVNSLNVSVAAGILAYEVVRQRNRLS